MNAEGWANLLVLRFLGQLPRGTLGEIPDDAIRSLRNGIRESLKDAARLEREACTRVAGSFVEGEPIAEAIRQRELPHPTRPLASETPVA